MGIPIEQLLGAGQLAALENIRYYELVTEESTIKTEYVSVLDTLEAIDKYRELRNSYIKELGSLA